MADMLQALPEQVGDVFVIQAIENLAALFAGADNAHLAQAAHLVGDRRLAKPDCLNDGADVQFAIQ